VLGSLSLFKKDNKEQFDVPVKRNQILIHGFEMSKILDDKSNYYIIKSKTAKMNRFNDNTALFDFDFIYKKGETDFEMSGKKADIIGGRQVKANGLITGRANELNFKSGENGIFFFDFLKNRGSLKNDVVYMQGKNTIKADESLFFNDENRIFFKGKVKVKYDGFN